MEWKCFQYADFCANTYLLIHQGHAVVFDPSQNSTHLLDDLQKKNITLDAIFLTHGHYDHIGGVNRLVHHYHCPIYLGEDEIEVITDPHKNVSLLFQDPLVIEEHLVPLYDGQLINVQGMEIQVMATPFHTKGSVCYFLPQLHKMVSGDTLFKGSIGRSDLPTGNAHQIEKSLNKLSQFAASQIERIFVYPGHGGKTILQEEIQTNPYFQK